jgi:hypothetical protein
MNLDEFARGHNAYWDRNRKGPGFADPAIESADFMVGWNTAKNNDQLNEALNED